ncbi:hypothetical protein ANCCAN_27357 [Ancylostoma caninum]|uniref:Transposase IS30-like HTH domain-containing protein n=1 Tax=Ancylostoma caninum TaxID=29170 RepID=A0A368F470_ANCCA|nr:hypothetical protein ANCCAN_27357 [Ancylostoma caninum]
MHIWHLHEQESEEILCRRNILSSVEQAQIEVLHDEGFSNRTIAAQLGRSHGLVDRYLRNPSTYYKQPNSVRPKLLTPNDSRMIKKLESDSTLSLAQMWAQLDLNISRMTMWRSVLGNCNIIREVMLKAPRSTP